MKLHIGQETVPIALNDSPVSRELCRYLPLSGKMMRYDRREFYLTLPFAPNIDGLETTDFHNGDVAFYPPYGTLAVFYDREGDSHCPGLIPVGRVTENLSIFSGLDGEVTVTLTEN